MSSYSLFIQLTIRNQQSASMVKDINGVNDIDDVNDITSFYGISYSKRGGFKTLGHMLTGKSVHTRTFGKSFKPMSDELVWGAVLQKKSGEIAMDDCDSDGHGHSDGPKGLKNEWSDACYNMGFSSPSLRFKVRYSLFMSSFIVIDTLEIADAFFEKYQSFCDGIHWDDVIRDFPDKGGLLLLLDVKEGGCDRDEVPMCFYAFDCRSFVMWNTVLCVNKIYDCLSPCHKSRDHELVKHRCF